MLVKEATEQSTDIGNHSIFEVTDDNSFKGFASESLVKTDLLARGIDVLQPIRPDLPYDLVAIVNSEYVRIQVKTGNRKDDHSITADVRKPPKGPHRYTCYYDESDYDIMAITDLKTRKVAYIPYGMYKRSITFRFEPRKRYNRNPEIYFDDFTYFPYHLFGKKEGGA